MCDNCGCTKPEKKANDGKCCEEKQKECCEKDKGSCC